MTVYGGDGSCAVVMAVIVVVIGLVVCFLKKGAQNVLLLFFNIHVVVTVFLGVLLGAHICVTVVTLLHFVTVFPHQHTLP